MAAKKTVDRVAGEMIEMATLFSKRGIVSMKNLEKIKALGTTPPAYTAEQVAAIRKKKAKMSQAVFAGFLNVRPSTIQKMGVSCIRQASRWCCGKAIADY
jgi:putative transcriptional regulator